MRITFLRKNLLLYSLFLTASIVFSSFYGGPISYALLYAFILLIPVSVIYIFINFNSLRVFQEVEVHKLTKGEEHQYRLILENEGFLPIYGMSISLYEDRCTLYDIEDRKKISLDSYEKREMLSGITCLYAGAYDVGVESVIFSDPFSIFNIRLKIPYSFRTVVRPQITDIAARFLDLENVRNNIGLKSMNLSENIPGADMRLYQKGDPLSSINWKVSARLSELVVRIPDQMETRTLTLLIQAVKPDSDMYGIDFLRKRDTLLEFGVSVAWYFGKQGVPVNLIYPSGKIVKTLVDTYANFMEFYNVVADGIYYDSNKEYDELMELVQRVRGKSHGDDTWIILKEDCDKEENFFTICG